MNGQIVYTNALVSNGTRHEKLRNDRKAFNTIKHTNTMDLKDMKKHGDDAFEALKVKEDNLVEAYNDKRLKSKELIKQAKRIIKRREEAALKKTEKTAEE